MSYPDNFNPSWPPQDAGWARTPKGRFYNLNTFNPEEAGISGVSGVYVIWHGGLRPGWIYVARTDDLAKSMEDALQDKTILSYHPSGGLFVSWSIVNRQFQDGVVRFLHTVLDPIVQNPDIKQDVKPVAVNAPGVSIADMKDPQMPMGEPQP